MPACLFSQEVNTSTRKNENNIYYQALRKYIELRQNKYGDKSDTFFIKYISDVTDSLLATCNGVKLIQLNEAEMEDYLKMRKWIGVIGIHPLNYDKGEFFIMITSFTIGYKYKKYNSLVGRNYSMFFSYDQGKFSYKREGEFDKYP